MEYVHVLKCENGRARIDYLSAEEIAVFNYQGGSYGRVKYDTSYNIDFPQTVYVRIWQHVLSGANINEIQVTKRYLTMEPVAARGTLARRILWSGMDFGNIKVMTTIVQFADNTFTRPIPISAEVRDLVKKFIDF